jgi:hypothetical protein
LLYRSENWIIKAREARKITAAEINYVEKQQEKLRQYIKIRGLQGN